MMLFAFAVVLMVAAVLLVKFFAREVNQGCRYRCTCVADTAALGALASIVENPQSHDR